MLVAYGMLDGSSARWLVKCAAAAALVLLTCAAAKPWLPTGMQAPATTARDGSLVALNRFMTEPTREVVLLGSSLTARIREDYFVDLDVRNLAIGGGSALTGLRILLMNRQKLPKTILVETNSLSNEADEGLIERYSTPGRDAFFRPVRMAIAAYESRLHQPQHHVDAVAAANRLLTESPREYDNEIYLVRVLGGFGQDATLALWRNVEQLVQLVAHARALGVRVLLFELPYADRLKRAPLVQDTRRLASGRFTDRRNWLHFDIATDELRWPDGLHMDERSAILTARGIENAIKERRE